MSITVKPAKNSHPVTVEVPSSKSYLNRALIIAALTETPVRLNNVSEFDDSRAMIDGLKTLGLQITQSEDSLVVENSIFDLPETNVIIDANQSATTSRFLTALCCLVPGEQTITGHESLLSRPIEPLIVSLKLLGAEISRDDKNQIIIRSHKLESGSVEVDSKYSSQFLTSLLLIAPVAGFKVKSEQISTSSYIEITKDIMHSFGVSVSTEDSEFSVQPQQYSAAEYTIEPDYSSASYFWALAALSGRSIKVLNTSKNTKQGDVKILDILEQFGAGVRLQPDGIEVLGGEINPVKADMSQLPDQAQTIAVIAAFSEGQSTLTGLGTLRHKETDRISATCSELNKLGIETESGDTSMIIFGAKPKSATVDTYMDHRMAMSFALSGSRLENGIEINNPEVVSKTFPEYWDKLKQAGLEIS
jgi:3-phosphoshikimate 1-carboxyvinyltransferase